MLGGSGGIMCGGEMLMVWKAAVMFHSEWGQDPDAKMWNKVYLRRAELK